MMIGGYPGMNPMMNPYFAMMGMGMRYVVPCKISWGNGERVYVYEACLFGKTF
jgi:hypothetical protein